MNDPAVNPTVVLIGLGLLSLAAGILTLREIIAGETLVAHEPRRPIPWGAGHVGLVLLVYLALIAAGMGVVQFLKPSILEQPGVVNPPAADGELFSRMLVNTVVSLLTAGFLLVLLRRTAGATWADLGFDLDWWREDAALGVRAFLVAAAPVYLVQWALSQWYPSQHPVQQMLQSSDGPGTAALAFIAAVLVAPVCEELVFRVLLQGWLETACARLGRNEPPPPFLPPSAPVPSFNVPPPTSGAYSSDTPGQYAPPVPSDDNPYRSPLAPPAPPVVHFGRVGTRWTNLLAIAASSALFAAVHSWPDMVALFFFAAALGYLYQRTHRVTAPIVMHFCLNLTSLVMTWLGT